MTRWTRSGPPPTRSATSTPHSKTALISSRLYATLWGYLSEALSGEAGALATEAPTSWTEWFRQAIEGLAAPNAIQVAERAVVEWSAEEFSAQDSRAIAGFLNRDIAPRAMRLVKDALPHFLQFIDRSAEPARHRELLDDIAVLLMSEEDLSVADVQAVANLAGLLLEIGLPAERYRQLVEDFCNLWERVELPGLSRRRDRHTRRALDPGVPESRSPGGSLPETPRQFPALAPQNPAGPVGTARRPRQRTRRIRGRAGYPATSGRSPDTAHAALARDALAGKTVAIYTLTERCGGASRPSS